jgi:hypothetical protein
MAILDISGGRQEMSQRGETSRTYVAIVLGVMMHFAWEILAAALRTGVKPDFGERWMIAARLGVALIVSAVSFVGIYKQLVGADPKLRFFLALQSGFAIDALTSPLGPATTGDMTSP